MKPIDRFSLVLRNRFVWSICLLLVSGCSGGASDAPRLAPVNGTVTLDGEPLEGATITFFSKVAGANGGAATSGPGGKFEPVTGSEKGLIPGEYEVTVSKLVKKDGADNSVSVDGTDDIVQLQMQGLVKNLVEEKYNDRKTSGLTVSVTEEGATPTIEVTSK